MLLVSILGWWAGLQGWASAQFGYLEVDAIGASPFLWVALIAITGAALVTGLLPRSRRARAVNLLIATLFASLAGILATPNVAAGADDGISLAGWALAALSTAQVGVAVAGLIVPIREAI